MRYDILEESNEYLRSSLRAECQESESLRAEVSQLTVALAAEREKSASLETRVLELEDKRTDLAALNIAQSLELSSVYQQLSASQLEAHRLQEADGGSSYFWEDFNNIDDLDAAIVAAIAAQEPKE